MALPPALGKRVVIWSDALQHDNADMYSYSMMQSLLFGAGIRFDTRVSNDLNGIEIENLCRMV
jgi:hypothetical protein